MKTYISPAEIYKKLEELERKIDALAEKPVNRHEAATILGIHPHTLDRKIRMGLIKARKAKDGVRYIPQSEINNYALGDN